MQRACRELGDEGKDDEGKDDDEGKKDQTGCKEVVPPAPLVGVGRSGKCVSVEGAPPLLMRPRRIGALL